MRRFDRPRPGQDTTRLYRIQDTEYRIQDIGPLFKGRYPHLFSSFRVELFSFPKQFDHVNSAPPLHYTHTTFYLAPSVLNVTQLLLCVFTTLKRVEHVTARLEIRTAEAEAMEAEELQNALNQPPDGGAVAAAAVAEGDGGGESGAAGAGGIGEGDESGASEAARGWVGIFICCWNTESHRF